LSLDASGATHYEWTHYEWDGCLGACGKPVASIAQKSLYGAVDTLPSKPLTTRPNTEER
jgi:hypothetical protein